jgi:hypothetical protein
MLGHGQVDLTSVAAAGTAAPFPATLNALLNAETQPELTDASAVS